MGSTKILRALQYLLTIVLGIMAGFTVVWSHCIDDKGCLNCSPCGYTTDYCCHSDPGCGLLGYSGQFYGCSRTLLCTGGSSSGSNRQIVGWFTTECWEAGECCSSSARP